MDSKLAVQLYLADDETVYIIKKQLMSHLQLLIINSSTKYYIIPSNFFSFPSSMRFFNLCLLAFLSFLPVTNCHFHTPHCIKHQLLHFLIITTTSTGHRHLLHHSHPSRVPFSNLYPCTPNPVHIR